MGPGVDRMCFGVFDLFFRSAACGALLEMMRGVFQFSGLGPECGGVIFRVCFGAGAVRAAFACRS